MSIKSRNHTVGGGYTAIDDASNVITFPNVVSSNLYVDSDDRTEGNTTDSIYYNRSNLVDSQVSSIGLKFVDLQYYIPNSNENNRHYSFQLEGSPTIHPFILPAQNYDDAMVLLTAIKDAMVDKVGALVITITPIAGTIKFKFHSTTPFKFVQSTGISYGVNLHGLKYTDGFTNEQTVTPKLFYTGYIDMFITDIKNAQVLRHSYTFS